MEIKTTVGELLGAVNKVWETTDIKVSSLFSAVYIKGKVMASGSWLYLYATDYVMQCLTKLEVDLDEDFEVVVDPGHLIRGISSLNHEKEVTITKKNDSALEIKCGRIKYKTACSSNITTHSTAFLRLPKLESTEVKINPIHLLSGIRSVSFAISDVAGHSQILRSLDVTAIGKSLIFAGTDGRILGKCSIELPNEVEQFKFNIAKSALPSIVKLTNLNIGGDLEIHEDGPYLKYADTLITLPTFTGVYPDVSTVLKKYSTVVHTLVDRKLFLEALRRAAVFLDGSTNNLISIKGNKDNLKIEANGFEEELDAVFDTPSSIKIDKGNFLNCISSCRGDNISIGFDKGEIISIKDTFKEEDVNISSSYIMMGSV